MAEKIIALEEGGGPFQVTLQRVMRKVPQRERSDTKLQRLIAFRLKQDGEAATSDYLIAKMKEVIDCAYTGRLYDFLKDDLKEKECFPHDRDPDPPEVA